MGSFFEVNRYCLDISQGNSKFAQLSKNVGYYEVQMIYLRDKDVQSRVKKLRLTPLRLTGSWLQTSLKWYI